MRRAGLLYTSLGALQRGLSLLLLPFVTRAMSVEDYGAVSVIVALGALAAAVVGTPFQAAVVRWTVRSPTSAQARDSLAAARIWLLLLAPAIVVCIGSLLMLLGRLNIVVALVGGEMIAVALGLHMSFFTLPSLRARSRLGAFTVAAVASIAAMLITKIVFVIVLGGGAVGWVISDAVAASVGLIVSLVISRQDSISARSGAAKSAAAFVVPLIAQSLSTWSMQNLSRPVLALMVPLSQLGVFAAAMNAVAAALIVIFEFNKSAVVEYSKVSVALLSPGVISTIRLQRLVAVGVCIMLGAAAPIFVAIVLPPEYASAAQLLGYLGLVPLLLGLYDLPMNLLVYAAGRPRLSWVPSTVGTTALAIGLLVLVPPLGLAGAGIATVLSYAAMLVAAFAVLRLSHLRVRWADGGFSSGEIALIAVATVPVSLSNMFSLAPIGHFGAILVGVAALSALTWTDMRKCRPA